MSNGYFFDYHTSPHQYPRIHISYITTARSVIDGELTEALVRAGYPCGSYRVELRLLTECRLSYGYCVLPDPALMAEIFGCASGDSIGYMLVSVTADSFNRISADRFIADPSADISCHHPCAAAVSVSLVPPRCRVVVELERTTDREASLILTNRHINYII